MRLRHCSLCPWLRPGQPHTFPQDFTHSGLHLLGTEQNAYYHSKREERGYRKPTWANTRSSNLHVPHQWLFAVCHIHISGAGSSLGTFLRRYFMAEHFPNMLESLLQSRIHVHSYTVASHGLEKIPVPHACLVSVPI